MTINVPIGSGTVYYEGKEVTISGCDIDFEPVKEYVRDRLRKTRPILHDGGLFVDVWIDRMLVWKLTGLWSWAANNCPNKRVVYLMNHGKTRRVQMKNFKRAVHIIERLMA